MTVTNYKIYAIKPKLATNRITNPSVETNTTGYTAVGGTIVASTTRARRGVKSLKVTPTSGNLVTVFTTHWERLPVELPTRSRLIFGE